MNPAHHARIKEVFLAVQSLPPPEWDAALEHACAGDIQLRQGVESLLAHHRSHSLLAVEPQPSLPKRIVQINVGHGATVKWDEEQRGFLHRRIKLWAFVLHLVVALALVRAFGILGGASGLVVGWIFVGLIGGALSVVGVSIGILLLKAPSYTRLRVFEVALNIAAAVTLFSWGYVWLMRGITLPLAPSEQLGKIFRGVYWVVSSDRSAYIQFPNAMLGQPIVTLAASGGALYALVVPNTPRRGSAMVAAIVLLPVFTAIAAALESPTLRPYLLKNILYYVVVVGSFSSSALYISLHFATLRRAVFDARQVGQYQLVRLLGKGAMGEVHLAQHHLLHRPCAIKLIRSDRAMSQDWLVRFEREVQAMAQLTHPNTVEVYDFGRTEDDSFFYAMEYLPGMALDALVREHGALPAGRVVYLMLQVCGALAEAHRRGLVHRDVKPGNIFVCERGGVRDFIKLLDFGLVRGQVDDLPMQSLTQTVHAQQAQLTQVGQLMGTPAFMSPEQIRGELLDARSDIYSLGCVTYFILTGQPPFECDTLSELFAAHIETPVPSLRDWNADVPGDVEAIVFRCLNKERESRFQSVAEVATALRQTEAMSEWDSARAEAWWNEHPIIVEPEAMVDPHGKTMIA